MTPDSTAIRHAISGPRGNKTLALLGAHLQHLAAVVVEVEQLPPARAARRLAAEFASYAPTMLAEAADILGTTATAIAEPLPQRFCSIGQAAERLSMTVEEMVQHAKAGRLQVTFVASIPVVALSELDRFQRSCFPSPPQGL